MLKCAIITILLLTLPVCAYSELDTLQLGGWKYIELHEFDLSYQLDAKISSYSLNILKGYLKVEYPISDKMIIYFYGNQKYGVMLNNESVVYIELLIELK
jgi:hypothetical protein